MADDADLDVLQTEWGPLYPYNLNGRIPKYIAQLAENKIGETPKKIQESIKLLKELMREMDSFQELPTDDDILLLFLRARKFRIFKAYVLLKNFYKNKKKFYENTSTDLELLEYEISLNMGGILPYRDHLGRIVVFGEVSKVEVDSATVDEYINMGLLVASKFIEDPVTQMCGVTCIVDLSGFDWKLLKFATKRNVSLVAQIFQQGFPARYGAAHIINEPMVVKLLYKTFGVFIEKKYKKRIHFHGNNYEELYEYYPPCMLPVKYGGTVENCDFPYTIQEVVNSKLFSF